VGVTASLAVATIATFYLPVDAEKPNDVAEHVTA
jgi:hypothetical protein